MLRDAFHSGLLDAQLASAALYTRHVTYLLLDRFTTDAAAPLASPRTCEPGPGGWTITASNNANIASGRLVLAAEDKDFFLSLEAFARKAGRAALALIQRTSGTFVGIGFSGGYHDLQFRGSNLIGVTNLVADLGQIANSTDYEIAVIQRLTGVFLASKAVPSRSGRCFGWMLHELMHPSLLELTTSMLLDRLTTSA